MRFFPLIEKILEIIFYRTIEFLFLLILMFLSFMSLRTPYEQLEKEINKEKDKKLSDLNIFRRFFSFFFFGAPLIYFGLKLSKLSPILIDYSNITTNTQLIIKLFSVIKEINPVYYVLVLIPFFVILVLKFQLERIWQNLNKESMRLFNLRIIQFRDYKLVKRVLSKAKDYHEEEFRKFTLDVIKSSRVLYVIYGIFLVFIVSTVFGNATMVLVTYMIPLSLVWALLCVFLTIFEKLSRN